MQENQTEGIQRKRRCKVYQMGTGQGGDRKKKKVLKKNSTPIYDKNSYGKYRNQREPP